MSDVIQACTGVANTDDIQPAGPRATLRGGLMELIPGIMSVINDMAIAYRVRSEVNNIRTQIEATLQRNAPPGGGVLIVFQIEERERSGGIRERDFISLFIADWGLNARDTIRNWRSRPQMTAGGSPGFRVRQFFLWAARQR